MFQNVIYTIPNLIVVLLNPSSPYYVGTFKLIIMKDLRIDIECILATDSVNLTKVQAKIHSISIRKSFIIISLNVPT